jgi:hypothetical protein
MIAGLKLAMTQLKVVGGRTIDIDGSFVTSDFFEIRRCLK